MAFIVETGEGVAGANAYISEAWFEAFAEDLGYTIPSGNVEAAIVRASLWVDATYLRRFPGTRKNGRDQGLHFPAQDGYDVGGVEIPDDEVPIEVKKATAYATLRELTEADSLSPDIVAVTTEGGAVKRTRKKLGPMETEIEYTEGATSGSNRPIFPVIDGVLARLLSLGGGAATVTLLRV